MQIDHIILRDVGPFKDVTIPLPAGKNPRLADVYLLTGPNGSGKSTVLYALAALIAGGSSVLVKDLLTRRFRTANAIAGFAAGDVHRALGEPTAAAFRRTVQLWPAHLQPIRGGQYRRRRHPRRRTPCAKPTP
jgi:energy-coupling factor transporter ATP-binding protein EcfA2